MTLAAVLSFYLVLFLFAPLFPSPPALCRYLLALLRVLFVQQQLSSSCCFRPRNRHLFLFNTHVDLLAAFPFRSPCITFFRTPVVRFALFPIFLFVFSPPIFYGLACFVVFSYPVP